MELPKRKRTRLRDYDYSSNGAYFITICTHEKAHILGRICRGGALLLPTGRICEAQIDEIQNRFNVRIDNYVIMPNHVHMIIFIDRTWECYSPYLYDALREEQSPSPTISDIVCAFKSITTKTANVHDKISGRKIWQRSFHDHVIRTEKQYKLIWEYIDTNPLKWEEDCFYTKN